MKFKVGRQKEEPVKQIDKELITQSSGCVGQRPFRLKGLPLTYNHHRAAGRDSPKERENGLCRMESAHEEVHEDTTKHPAESTGSISKFHWTKLSKHKGILLFFFFNQSKPVHVVWRSLEEGHHKFH